MQELSPLFFRPLYQGVRAFFMAFTKIVLFELCFKAITAIILRPFLSFILQFILTASGKSLVFNEQMLSFLLSVPGVLAVLILAGLSTVLVYFEFATIISLLRQARKDQISPHISTAISEALWSFKSLKSPGVILFSIYSLALLPLINMGVTSSILPEFSIPNFITGELNKTASGEWLLLLLAIVMFLIFFSLLFVVPSMVLEHTHFGTAVVHNIRAIKAYGIKMVGILIVFVAFWLLMFVLPREFSESVFGLPNVSLLDALNFWGFSFRTIGTVLVWAVITLAAQVVVMPLLLTVLISYYIQVGAPVDTENNESISKIEHRVNKAAGTSKNILHRILQYIVLGFQHIWNSTWVRRHKKIIVAVLLLAVLVYGIFSVFLMRGMGDDPIVIGHRGSIYGVENTLESIDAAIEKGADFVEVDVQLTADNVPVVVHDFNLKRVSGLDINVYDLTLEQIQEIPLKQNGYTGRVSTLEEIVEHCDGKIFLAVELKSHGQEEEDLVTKAMDIIEKSEFQRDCVIFSQDYELSQQMVLEYPDYRIGYCIYGNIGNLSRSRLESMGIQFLVAEESMITKKMVGVCRRAGVSVYAWTVNERKGMGDLLRLGVVGLITDKPDLAYDVIHSSQALAIK